MNLNAMNQFFGHYATASPQTVPDQIRATVERNRGIVGETTFALGGFMPGGAAVCGGILTPDGTIVCPGHESSQTIIFNTVDFSIKKHDIPGWAIYALTAGGYSSLVDSVFSVPFSMLNFIKTDYRRGIDIPVAEARFARQYGGVFAPNGVLYCAPSDSNAMWLNPQNNVTGSIDLGANGFRCAGLSYNNWVYFCPYASDKLVRVSIEDNTVEQIDITETGSGKYRGVVTSADGRLFFIPNNATRIMVVNPTTKEINYFGNFTGNNKWAGGTLAPDGKIYCAPCSASQMLIINPEDNSTELVGNFGNSSFKYMGIKLAQNGKLYAIPYNATNFLEVTLPQGLTNFSDEVLLSGYMNKF